jgi:hypothetical protein
MFPDTRRPWARLIAFHPAMVVKVRMTLKQSSSQIFQKVGDL